MKVKRLPVAVAVAVIPLIVLAASCEITIHFWEGSDSSVQYDWWIDGAAANSTNCAAVNASQVRMSVSEVDGSFEWWDDFYWQCSAGTADTGLAFATGSYWFAWQLIGPSSNAISATEWYADTLAVGSNDLGYVDFVTGTATEPEIQWSWTIEGHAWDDTLYAGLCPWATGDVTTIRLSLDTNDDGTTDEAYDAQCVWGEAVTPDTATFTVGQSLAYSVALMDSADTVLSETAWYDVTLVAGTNDLPLVDFDLGDYGPLDVLVQWGDKELDPAFGDCTLPPADVAIMGYLLSYSTGDIADVVDIDTDPMTCTTDLSWLETDFDTYELILDGEDTLGTTLWGSTCINLVVDDETANAWGCDALMTVSP